MNTLNENIEEKNFQICAGGISLNYKKHYLSGTFGLVIGGKYIIVGAKKKMIFSRLFLYMGKLYESFGTRERKDEMTEHT